jgi:DNA-binding response OmpR family regulator
MDTARTIAVVEDEAGLRDDLRAALEGEGWRVAAFADGLAAWESFQASLPDLAVLDIMMPRMDGLELCRRLRGASRRLPIIFLTSRDDEFDRVLGLELGADDYLCKPFSMRELIARIRVLFRRLDLSGSEATRNLIEVGPLRLDLDRHIATLGGTPLNLTVTEFLILAALARRPGVVKTRGQLMEEGYPYDTLVAERTIDTHVKRLRKKLSGADPSGAELIETVYGLGYRLRGGG